MPSVNLSPIFNGYQAFGTDGRPLSGGFIYTYQAGTSTPMATYTTQTGNIANANPIVLGPDGRPPQEIWLVQGQGYFFDLQSSLLVSQGTYDNIYGIDSTGGPNSLRVQLADPTNVANGDALVAVKRTETGAVGRTLHFYIQHSKLLLSNFCDPTADTPSQVSAALATAITAARTNDRALVFDPGATYTADAETVFFTGATNNNIRLRFWGQGSTIYRSSGAGQVASLDSGGAGAYNAAVEFVDFILRGNASSTYGLYMRGISQNSLVRADVYDIATAGFYLGFAVVADFDLACSNNLHTFAVNPAKGIILDHSGSGADVADCDIKANIGPGITDIGIHAMYTSLGTKIRGTSEGIPRGLLHDSTCAELILDRMDFESNTDYDVKVLGRGLEWQGCNAASAGATGTVVVGSSAMDCRFIGGYARWVALDNASIGTNFYGLRVSDNASLGITGPTGGSTPAAGTHKRYGCTKVNTSRVVTGYYTDLSDYSALWSLTNCLRQSGAQTPTATANSNVYRFANQEVHFRGSLTAVGAGTAGSAILIDFSSSIAIPTSQLGQAVGQFIAVIGGTQYAGVVIAQAATTLSFSTSAGTSLLGINPGATLAAGSTLLFSACWDFGG